MLDWFALNSFYTCIFGIALYILVDVVISTKISIFHLALQCLKETVNHPHIPDLRNPCDLQFSKFELF